MSRILGPIRQNAYVVRDLRAAIRHWTEVLGVGPFFVLEHSKLEWFAYRGHPSPAPDLSVALAQSGAMQIELIEQHDDTPSLYREFLDAGREGFHHFAFWCADYGAAYESLLARGYSVGHEGGAGGVRFAYLDTSPHLAPFVEIVELPPWLDQAHERIAAAAVGWDGSDPIRPFEIS